MKRTWINALCGIALLVINTGVHAEEADSTQAPPFNPKALELQENMVEDKALLYALPAVTRNYQAQKRIVGDTAAPGRYVMLDNLGTFEPRWASAIIFDIMPYTDACLYGAWVNDKQAKRAINLLANAAPRIQIASDYISGRVKMDTQVTLQTMSKHTQIRRQAVEKSQVQYKPLTDAVQVCLSDRLRAIKRKIERCDPDKEICPCYVTGKRGLAKISVDPGVNNQGRCS